jgi:hypothetical protein
MPRLRVGPDEIRFAEADRAIAETLARLLPEIRQKGQDIVELTAPSLRFAISSEFPGILTVLRPTTFAALTWAAVTLAAVGLSALARDPVAALVLLASMVAVPGWWVRASWRRGRSWWPHCGGLAFGHSGIMEPVIALHYPPPPPLTAAKALLYPSPSLDVALTFVAAHEYGHILLQSGYRTKAIPTWLNEGFAFWFAEQAAGQPVWRPESRACVEEPEPQGNPYEQFGSESYCRLAARYYWEVRSLADRGLLLDVLRAPLKCVNDFRPQLRAP